jgi:ParB family chromosome partitioning protein
MEEDSKNEINEPIDLNQAAERLKKFNLEGLAASEEAENKDEVLTSEAVKLSVLGDLPEGHIFQLEINSIEPNPQQPRVDFNEIALEELAESIKEHGIIQPLVVNKFEEVTPAGTQVKYYIIAGERRWRAAAIAGLPTVPAIIRETQDDNRRLELALVENLQRENLNPIEEAKAYRKLMDDFGLSQQDVGYRIGRSPEKVSNTLRLLNLPLEIQNALAAGLISEGHGRAILGILGPEKQRTLLREILDKAYSVRQTEEKVRDMKVDSIRSPRSVVTLSPEFKDMVERLENILGTKVRLTPRGDGGRITIEYYSSEDLENIIRTFIKSREEGEDSLADGSIDPLQDLEETV